MEAADTLLSEETEKDMLISEVQILSLVRFNMPFNYLTVHLCKHPHPLQPWPRNTHSAKWKKRHTGRLFYKS